MDGTPQELTNQQIQALLDLESKATAGWWSCTGGDRRLANPPWQSIWDGTRQMLVRGEGANTPDNMRFIVAARNTFRQLCLEVLRHRANKEI